MPATDVFELEIMDLVFLNLPFDNIGDATGLPASAAPGNMEHTIHTSTLDDTSTQTTGESAYTGYARQDVVRSGAGYTNTAGTVSNDAAIIFGEKTAGLDETVTDFGVGSDVVANELWFYGALTASLSVTNGVNPQFAIGDLDITVT
jgi:hypothetical protein